ncbi:hypothetical protein SAMN05518672_101325 [Chitinophaga sp. CF118]|nr:hypothetical protein SAMN05518672_101325 [Chitinophaga sp. CF118]
MLLNELDNPNLLGQDFYLAREQDNLPLILRCPRMTSVLYVHFDVSFKSGSPDFKIHSPLVLPQKVKPSTLNGGIFSIMKPLLRNWKSLQKVVCGFVMCFLRNIIKTKLKHISH